MLRSAESDFRHGHIYSMLLTNTLSLQLPTYTVILISFHSPSCLGQGQQGGLSVFESSCRHLDFWHQSQIWNFCKNFVSNFCIIFIQFLFIYIFLYFCLCTILFFYIVYYAFYCSFFSIVLLCFFGSF